MRFSFLSLASMGGLLRLALFGTMVLYVGQVAWATSTVATILSFGKRLRGALPMGSVALAADGSLYGTTSQGGQFDGGTIFKLDPKHGHRVLHSFQPGHGQFPQGSLARSGDGTLYGVTSKGGRFGFGTLYRFSPTGQFSVLHDVGEGSSENPYVFGVSLGPDGSLYGVTNQGGNRGAGVVFRLTPEGRYQILHHFDVFNGYRPGAGVILGPDNALYGTTSLGGYFGYGTVYRLERNGRYRVLHEFNGTDGALPLTGLTLGFDRNLYGTTGGYGAHGGFGGTLFRITPSGQYTVLHQFKLPIGSMPKALMAVAPDSSLFGLTRVLGTGGVEQGAIYRRRGNGEFSIVHTFSPDDGDYFDTGLTLAPDGSFYGTTMTGGPFHNGTVFRLDLFDADNDGIDNYADNCIWISNRDQRDTDGDGYGNLCDADLNNSGLVTLRDMVSIASRFGTADPNADLDGNGRVNRRDLGLARRWLRRAPGPSGVAH